MENRKESVESGRLREMCRASFPSESFNIEPDSLFLWREAHEKNFGIMDILDDVFTWLQPGSE